MKTGAKQLRVHQGHNLTQTARPGKIHPSNVLTSTNSDQIRLNPGKKNKKTSAQPQLPPFAPVKFSAIRVYPCPHAAPRWGNDTAVITRLEARAVNPWNASLTWQELLPSRRTLLLISSVGQRAVDVRGHDVARVRGMSW